MSRSLLRVNYEYSSKLKNRRGRGFGTHIGPQVASRPPNPASAIPPKADISRMGWHVRKVPKADNAPQQRASKADFDRYCNDPKSGACSSVSLGYFVRTLIPGGTQCQKYPVAVFAVRCATSAMPNHWEQQFATAPTVKRCPARHSL
jgi:hypothetical protein